MLPDVPTIAESGYAGFETTAWWGLFAPAKLPAALTQALAAEVERIVAERGIPQQARAAGRDAVASQPARDFAEFQRERTGQMGQGRARLRCDRLD